MGDTICLPTNHIIIIFCVFIGCAVWYIHNDKKKHLNDPNYNYNDKILTTITKNIDKNNKNNSEKTIEKLENKLENKLEEKISDFMEKRIYLTQRDRDVLYNDLHAPERRMPEYAYPTEYVKRAINMPTRGYPDNYQMLGVCLRNNTESAYSFFGRQKFPGSNQWEYYAIADNSSIKIPIKIRGDREAEDGQTIYIPGTDPSKGDYKLKLYDYDVPRYNPYVLKKYF